MHLNNVMINALLQVIFLFLRKKLLIITATEIRFFLRGLF